MAYDSWGGSWGAGAADTWALSWVVSGSTLDPYLLYYFGRGRTHGAIKSRKSGRRC